MKSLLRFSALVLTVLFLFALPGSEAEAVHWRYIRFNGREYVNLNRIGTNYGLKLCKTGKNVELRGTHHRFVFTPEKTFLLFNGVNITLNHALLENRGSYYLSRLDFDSTVRVMLSSDTLRRHPLRKIVLDPGHGGKDAGARGRYFRESLLNLELARRVKAKLEKAGYTVVLTRRNDVFVDLARRPEIAEERGADLFLSLHMNASLNRNVSGIETYCLTPAGAASSSGGRIENERYPGNSFDRNNMALAYLIQRSLISKTGAEDLGVKHARFLVLKQSKMPAVLIESGFLSNRSEEQQIGNDAYQERLADAIVRGVNNYGKAVGR